MKPAVLIFVALFSFAIADKLNDAIDQDLREWPSNSQLPMKHDDVNPPGHFPFTFANRGIGMARFQTRSWSVKSFSAKRTSPAKVNAILQVDIDVSVTYAANGSYNWAGGRYPMTVDAVIPMKLQVRYNKENDSVWLVRVGTPVQPGTTATVTSAMQYASDLYAGFLQTNAVQYGDRLALQFAKDIGQMLNMQNTRAAMESA